MRTLTVLLFFAVLVSLNTARGQCGNGCYPYLFCPPTPNLPYKGPEIKCSSCPLQEAGFSVYHPGLPNSICEIKNYFADQLGAQTLYLQKTSDNFIPVMLLENIRSNVSYGLSKYDKICSDPPLSSCCLKVHLDVSTEPFTSNGQDPTMNPAFTELYIRQSSCELDCSTNDIVTHLNFSEEFITMGDPGGWRSQGIWTVQEQSNLPTPLLPENLWDHYGLSVYNMPDVITHEIGHFVGFPQEDLVQKYAPACMLDGILQSMAWDLPQQGLTEKEKC